MAEEPTTKRSKKEFDPDDYRMTIGEHLEELRWRLILGLAGLVVAAVACLIMGDRIIVIFLAPLITALRESEANASINYTQISDKFMTYLKVSLICAMAIAGPWILYQLWRFVAAGLYPNERKTITRYIPLSALLFVGGTVFVYFLVLPLTIRFMIGFGSDWTSPSSVSPTTHVSADQIMTIPRLEGDPVNPLEGQIWYNKSHKRLKCYFEGQINNVACGPDKLTSPVITLPDYVDMVMLTMVVFGLAFQLPLVIMALMKIGIVEPAGLRKSRRVVYFILAIVAAAISPGDVVITMLAMLLPLILLYELGIFLGVRSIKTAEAHKS